MSDNQGLSHYKRYKQSYENYRHRVRRFTFQFSLQDKEALEWFEQQANKGMYLKQLILEDKRRKLEGCIPCSKTN